MGFPPRHPGGETSGYLSVSQPDREDGVKLGVRKSEVWLMGREQLLESAPCLCGSVGWEQLVGIIPGTEGRRLHFQCGACGR